MKNNFIIAIMCAGFMFLNFNGVSAAQLDAYKKMVSEKTFTLKYNVTPKISRQTNRETTAYGLMTMRYFDLDSIKSKTRRMVVETPNARYQETATNVSQLNGKVQEENATCALIRNGDYYDWRRTQKGKSVNYAGRVRGGYVRSEVVANSSNLFKDPYDALQQVYNYGNPIIAHFLGAIVPPNPNETLLDIPQYSFKGSGKTSEGLTYEDYRASKNGKFYAIRFYFNDNIMKKAAMVISSNPATSGNYERYVIDIEEFSSMVDPSYLSLDGKLRIAEK